MEDDVRSRPLERGDRPTAGGGGMANTTPPALPGAAAPQVPPPPVPLSVREAREVRAGMGGVRGVLPPAGSATTGAEAAGQDIRHRGWYWHWNTLITQYAPLLGLKGVGLLNSYTVWTDRREGSPHQGFAFPAQVAEARFYGEGREELITLNKLLVALDLIEIQKEMVLRTDERGRRWRVPHNFYRVKDPRDGLVLNLPAVVRVLELAQRDRNAFRHIRHIFNAQFAPIDRTSIWHYLLPELRALPLWRELAARAERERRGSRKLAALPADPDAADPSITDSVETFVNQNESIVLTSDNDQPSTVVTRNIHPLATDIDASHDTGLVTRTYVVVPIDAENAPAEANDGQRNAIEGSIDDEGMIRVESALPSIVVPVDRTENQGGESREETTSTTSTSTRESVSDLFAALTDQGDTTSRWAVSAANAWDRFDAPVETQPDEPDADGEWDTQPEGDAPASDPQWSGQPLPPAPTSEGDEEVVVRALDVTESSFSGAEQQATMADIEAALTMANGRPPNDMEMSLLVQVARDCDAAARDQSIGPGNGLGWVLAAIWEAVNSGSTFVAPKRIATICDRWAAEGFGSDRRIAPTATPTASSSYPPPPVWPPFPATTESGAFPTVSYPPFRAEEPRHMMPDVGYAPVPPATTPGTATSEADAARLWEQVTRRFVGVLHQEFLDRYFTGVHIVAVAHDHVTVQVPGADAAQRLAQYRGLISRKMSEVLGRTVDVTFQSGPVGQAGSVTDTGPTPTIQPQSTQVNTPSSPWATWPPQSATSSDALPVIPEAQPAPSATGSFPTTPPEAAPPPAPVTPALPSGALATPLSAQDQANARLWAIALRDLQARLPGPTFEVWMRSATLIGTDTDDTVVIGARNRVQKERLERNHLGDLAAVLGALLERPVGVRVAIVGEYDARQGGGGERFGSFAGDD